MSAIEEVTPQAAYNALKSEGNSFLVDVRTLPEWAFVGIPEVSSIGKKVNQISWKLFPQMSVNENFAEQIQAEIPDKNAKIFFLCKVGGRSYDAANFAEQLGYKNAYNIIGGFEGDADENSQRGKINGWKGSGLPWVQS